MNKYLNWNVFSYEEIITILLDEKNWLHDYVSRWFVLDDDFKYEDSIFDDPNYSYELSFGEDCIEIGQDDYWLVNFRDCYAYSIHDLSEIEERLEDK